MARIGLVVGALFVASLACLTSVPLASAEDVDYYAVLGLEKEREDATEADIKRQYRKLSKQYHPDLHPTEEARATYVKVQRANEVLSDRRKRKIYDMKGDEGLKQLETAGANAGRHEDPFMRLFGMGGGQQTKGQNMQLRLEVPLADVYNGNSHQITINKQKLCKTCRGSGAASKSDLVKCDKCKGKGAIMQRIQLAPGFVQQAQTQCPKCGGTGKMISRPCGACGGHKVTRGDTPLSVEIERGIPDGHDITFEMEADQSPDLIPGDVIIKVAIRDDDRFKRRGNDLLTTVRLSLEDALVGFTKTIQHMDGHPVVVSEKGVTQHGTKRRIAGEGMPIHNVPSEKGELEVTYEFDMPKRLTAEQEEVFKSLL